MDKLAISYEIFQCVDRGLSAISSSVAHVTYWRLLTVYDVKPSDIATDPETFSRALSEIFGSGAVLLERSIVKDLAAKFQMMWKKLPSFPEAVKNILNEERYEPLQAYAAIPKDRS